MNKTNEKLIRNNLIIHLEQCNISEELITDIIDNSFKNNLFNNIEDFFATSFKRNKFYQKKIPYQIRIRSHVNSMYLVALCRENF